jgi:gluconate 2-dehydrogenase gamma chain
MQPTRREAIVTLAAIAAASPSEAQAAFLTPAELAWLSAITEAIIPRTDTPGAIEAGVPAFIDRRLAAAPQLADSFRTGMKSFDAAAQSRFDAAFPALTVPQQLELLKAHADDPFVRMLKGMTVDGYYSSKEGLSQELGWHGNTYLSEFKGCIHPEHQA